MNKAIIGMIGVVILVGVGAFFGGMRYGKQNIGAAFTGQSGFRNGAANGQGFIRGQRGGNGMSNAITGEIILKDDKNITIKLRDGGSKIIIVADSTQIMKSIAGAFGDLRIGDQIMSFGTPNADGSLTAQSIQIRPIQTPNR